MLLDDSLLLIHLLVSTRLENLLVYQSMKCCIFLIVYGIFRFPYPIISFWMGLHLCTVTWSRGNIDIPNRSCYPSTMAENLGKLIYCKDIMQFRSQILKTDPGRIICVEYTKHSDISICWWMEFNSLEDWGNKDIMQNSVTNPRETILTG
mgnify:CR=1 FL=1